MKNSPRSLKKQIKALELKIKARKSKVHTNYQQVKKTMTSPAVTITAATLSGLAITGAILYKKKHPHRPIRHRGAKNTAAVDKHKIDVLALLAGLVSILKLLHR